MFLISSGFLPHQHVPESLALAFASTRFLPIGKLDDDTWANMVGDERGEKGKINKARLIMLNGTTIIGQS